MNSTTQVSTNNTRIREMPEFPGAKVEAIATGINIDYKPVNPLETTMVLSYQDFVTNEEGTPFPFTAPGLTPIHLSLAELYQIAGEHVDIDRMMAELKIISDLVHNARNAPPTTLTPQPEPEPEPEGEGEPKTDPEPSEPEAE